MNFIVFPTTIIIIIRILPVAVPVAADDAFGASIFFYCIFNPIPEESNAAVDAGESILLGK